MVDEEQKSLQIIRKNLFPKITVKHIPILLVKDMEKTYKSYLKSYNKFLSFEDAKKSAINSVEKDTRRRWKQIKNTINHSKIKCCMTYNCAPNRICFSFQNEK